MDLNRAISVVGCGMKIMPRRGVGRAGWRVVLAFVLLMASTAAAFTDDSGISGSIALPSDLIIDKNTDPDVLCYVGVCKSVFLENMGEGRLVKDIVENMLLLDPKTSFLHAKMAEILYADKEYRRALAECELAVAINPDNADALYLIGLLNLQRRDRDGAVESFRRVALLKPEHLQAQSLLGTLLYEAGDYAGAALAYSEVVKLRPYDAKLRFRLGTSYSESGEIDKAIMEFNAAIRLNGDYLEARFVLARLYAQLSLYNESIEECLALLKSVPEDPNVNLLLAEMYVSTGDFDMAIPRAEMLLNRRRIDKEIEADAYFRLAAAYKGKGENAQARTYFLKSIETYERILIESPDKTGIHYQMAMVFEAMGDLASAERHLRKYMELVPDEPNTYNFLGYMLVEADSKLDEALRLIMRAVEMEPKNGAFRDSLGWVLFKMGDLDKAIVELEKAVEYIPEDSDIRVHLGEVYLKKGGEYVEKAVLEWEKALQIKPNNAALQRRLDELRKSLKRSDI